MDQNKAKYFEVNFKYLPILAGKGTSRTAGSKFTKYCGSLLTCKCAASALTKLVFPDPAIPSTRTQTGLCWKAKVWGIASAITEKLIFLVINRVHYVWSTLFDWQPCCIPDSSIATMGILMPR